MELGARLSSWSDLRCRKKSAKNNKKTSNHLNNSMKNYPIKRTKGKKKLMTMKTILYARLYSILIKLVQMISLWVQSHIERISQVVNRSSAVRQCFSRWCQKFRRMVIQVLIQNHSQATYNLQPTDQQIKRTKERGIARIKIRILLFILDSSPRKRVL